MLVETSDHLSDAQLAAQSDVTGAPGNETSPSLRWLLVLLVLNALARSSRTRRTF